MWRKVRRPALKQEMRLSMGNDYFTGREDRGCILKNTRLRTSNLQNYEPKKKLRDGVWSRIRIHEKWISVGK
jgi:hypothetical protein